MEKPTDRTGGKKTKNTPAPRSNRARSRASEVPARSKSGTSRNGGQRSTAAKPPAAKTPPATSRAKGRTALAASRAPRRRLAGDVPSESLVVGRGTAPVTGLEPGSVRGELPAFPFPGRYETNRVRLIIRDPEWLFAYWEVSPRSMDALKRELGEHTFSLSRLTLRLRHADHLDAGVILLPQGARGWYIHVETRDRTYCVELGVTLPSGEFRRLAESNVVTLSHVGASPDAAGRDVDYRDAWNSAVEIPTGAGVRRYTVARQGPTRRVPGASAGVSEEEVYSLLEERSGASDLFRR